MRQDTAMHDCITPKKVRKEVELCSQGDSLQFEAPMFAISMPACCTLVEVAVSPHPRIALK